jgi:hypothetical protein
MAEQAVFEFVTHCVMNSNNHQTMGHEIFDESFNVAVCTYGQLGSIPKTHSY